MAYVEGGSPTDRRVDSNFAEQTRIDLFEKVSLLSDQVDSNFDRVDSNSAE